MTNPGGLVPEGRVLDRAALERVLARAMELHVRSDTGSDAGSEADELSESRVLDIAREVGIAPEAVRQASAPALRWPRRNGRAINCSATRRSPRRGCCAEARRNCWAGWRRC